MHKALLGESRLNNNDTSENSHTQNIVWLQMRPVVALDSRTHATHSQTDTHISWLHSDHLLTTRAATDADQNLIWRWYSDVFGVGEAESLTQAGQTELTLNLRFPGQYHDAESGLHYNYFRSYDPSMGRYTQSDPIGLDGGFNTYSYTYSNPLIGMDLYGLDVEVLIGGAYGSTTYGHVALGRETFGFRYGVDEVADRNVISYYSSLIEGVSSNISRGEYMKQYYINDYHAANNNCTTVVLDGLESGIPRELYDAINNVFFDKGLGLSWVEKIAFNAAKDQPGIVLPLDC